MVLVLFSINNAIAQPCYPNQIVTAAYATGGTSPYKDQVLWLTWGSSNQTTDPYGKHNQPLTAGNKSYASISLGSGKYLCVEAEIISITGTPVNSYAPGNFVGDSFDNLYNIGGTGANNKLVAGIRNRNDGRTSTLRLRCKATIGSVPIRIAGLVIADAESLAPTEYIYATADGRWTIVELKKNVGAGDYRVRKENVNGTTQQIMRFLRGNDNNTTAISFLSFNESAYNNTGINPDLSVQFTATLKGGGLTALAIGLLTPNADLGDAPESYGSPIHLLQNLTFTSDGINPNPIFYTNINTIGYNPGALVSTLGSYLGSTPPDADNNSMFSKDALGDDNSGDAGIDEEDTWPIQYKRFSYKAYYMPGNIISAQIPYKGAKAGARISGWIDFNRNGTFDTDERQTAIVPANGDGNVALQWTVPSVRKPYSTYVRLRYFDPSEPDATSPDSNVNFGEVEDHRMYILGPAITNPGLPSKAKQ
ncbi:CshA/CshB family fibrillar adhesin-related protein [Parapedobacter tibetensis]|uniref:CshA/CshB family fibrillar adhesin-related protein n=1 Tax=Parapedobacter tibetensis TaxID=2972951 RepID=UPI00214D2D8C|nr:CshA/CshB family fibrillar adhesin-related protein [Parapedobacter tibetensis]